MPFRGRKPGTLGACQIKLSTDFGRIYGSGGLFYGVRSMRYVKMGIYNCLYLSLFPFVSGDREEISALYDSGPMELGCNRGTRTSVRLKDLDKDSKTT